MIFSKEIDVIPKTGANSHKNRGKWISVMRRMGATNENATQREIINGDSIDPIKYGGVLKCKLLVSRIDTKIMTLDKNILNHW